MINIYNHFKRIDGMSIENRILAFKNTVIEMIEKGQNVEILKDLVQDFEDDEMYEASQGILSALQDFEMSKKIEIHLN